MTGVLLAALVAAGPALPAGEARRWVALSWDAQTRGCAASVNGVPVGDPDSDAGRAALIRALPDHAARVPLRGGDTVPYRCVDAVVTALQRAGYPGVTIGIAAPATSR